MGWTASQYELFEALAQVVRVLFAIAFGACVGSLINVLVYRLPLGLGVVTPPSRCPSCETRLTWRENIPIFGWLFLKGRCRFCRSKISPEYPLVELLVGVIFAITYLVLYAERGMFLGINFGAIRPEWARNGFTETWPVFIVVLMLFSSLVAMTLTDLKSYTIPLVLTWFPAIVAVIAHPAAAMWIQQTQGGWSWVAKGEVWAIATPGVHGWWWIGAALGGAVGLVLANVLMSFGVIGRSFADYEAWEKQALADRAAEAGTDEKHLGHPPETSPPEMWIQYPHARREMLRELIFLSPCIGLALCGGWVARKLAGPWAFDPGTGLYVPSEAAPLWLTVLAGVILGYLIGGGIVWAVRIFGSMAFGKEAMGLGDVHLLAAVGACLGWVDATLTLFAAVLLGLIWPLVSLVTRGKLQRQLPFGPWLAAGAMAVFFAKPLIERFLTVIMGFEVPLDLP